jgi:hypothetical protein
LAGDDNHAVLNANRDRRMPISRRHEAPGRAFRRAADDQLPAAATGIAVDMMAADNSEVGLGSRRVEQRDHATIGRRWAGLSRKGDWSKPRQANQAKLPAG